MTFSIGQPVRILPFCTLATIEELLGDGMVRVKHDPKSGVNVTHNEVHVSMLEAEQSPESCGGLSLLAGSMEPPLPTVGGFVQLPQSCDSSAGKIQNLVEHAVGGVGIIHSRKDSVRANHWHREDWHYLFVVSGGFEYEEWDPKGIAPSRMALAISAAAIVGKPIPPDETLYLTVGPGQMIFTPPNRAHRLRFTEDTVMVSVSKLNRTHASHESDVVRL